jgi:hypothetical protein
MTIRLGVVGPDIGAPVAERLSSLPSHSLRILIAAGEPPLAPDQKPTNRPKIYEPNAPGAPVPQSPPVAATLAADETAAPMASPSLSPRVVFYRQAFSQHSRGRADCN